MKSYVSKYFKAFSLSEVIMTLGIMGLLAVTMLGLNNFQTQSHKIALTKLAQVDSALKSWGKAISNSNESGLGVNENIKNQNDLNNSLLEHFNSKITGISIDKNIATGDKITNTNEFILDNGVKLNAKYIIDPADPTKDKFCTDSTACAVLLASIETVSAGNKVTLQEEYALLSNGIKSTDSIYEGWKKSPISAVTIDGETKYYYCSQESCKVTGCNINNYQECTLAPEECQTGNCANVYTTEPQYAACVGNNQTGQVETWQIGTIISGSSTTIIDKCCITPLIFQEYDKNNNKICKCPPSESINLTDGYIYAEDANLCQFPCPKGTYAKYSITGGECIRCDEGKYCPQEATIETTQLICPKGYYCPPKGSRDDKNYCDISYRLDKDGKTILAGGLIEKIICSKGHYCPEEGLTEEILCPKGTYCPNEGMIEPIKCPAGTYSDVMGATDSSTCKPCPEGTYSDTAGSEFCIACLIGTFTPSLAENATIGATSCTGCPAGSYYDNKLGECKLCPAGTYQDKEGQLKCEPCPSGYYMDKEGATSCLLCPEGYEAPTEGSIECLFISSITCEDYGDPNLIYISTPEELAKIGNDPNYPLSGNYCQIKNIDMKNYTKFRPIGCTSTFTGKYDGNLYNISNLKIVEEKCVTGTGLFASVSGTIKRLGVIGSVTGNSYTGGIAGKLLHGNISNSYFTGEINGLTYVGGLVGSNHGGNINSSYTSGNINSRSYSGGLVGYNATGGKINNVYTNVTMPANFSGGLVGYSSTTSKITFAYTVSKSNKNNSFFGINTESSCEECYASTELYEEWDDNNNTEKIFSPNELKVSKGNKNLYSNWSESNWCFNCGNYPVLKNMPQNAPDWISCSKKCSCPEGAKGVYDDCECPIEASVYNPIYNICSSCPNYGTLYIFKLDKGACQNRTLKNLIKLSGNTELLNLMNQKGIPDRFFKVDKGEKGIYCEPSHAYAYDSQAETPTFDVSIYIVSRYGDIVAAIPNNSKLLPNNCYEVCDEENCSKYCGIEDLIDSDISSNISEGEIKINYCPYTVSSGYFRLVSPLVLDLLNDGLSFSPLENGIKFDLNADGEKEQIAWTRIQDKFDNAFLCIDKNNNGNIDNGSELFGNQSDEKTGFEELAKYDNNGDGKITEADESYSKLLLWVDFNKNGKVDYYRIVEKTIRSNGTDTNTTSHITYQEKEVCEPNGEKYPSDCQTDELKTLKEMKITELSTKYSTEVDKDGNIKTDIYGNTTGFVGQFKILIEEVIDGILTLVEKVQTMIDVFFVSLFN